MKRIALMAFCLAACAYAQAQAVRGTVKDQAGKPLAGVTVTVKGKNAGTTSSAAGAYSITAVAAADTLVFNLIGYSSISIPVKGHAIINATLDEDAQKMDEVVVIGYGTQKRSDLTGSISSLSEKEISMVPVNNIAEALTGKLAGVQVVTTDGAPDAEVSMLIRGRNSITQSSAPLYVVDGFMVESISDIAQSDIASIDVLKDASATAIYGSRGANGVVIITTKSAKTGTINVSLNAYFGLRQTAPMPGVLDPYEYALWQYELSTYRNNMTSAYEPTFGSWGDMHLYKDYPGNDWKKIVFGQTGTSQNYNIALSGTTDKSNYTASYTKQIDDAVMITSGFERDNFLFKFQHKPSRKLTLNFQARYSATRTTGSGANEQTGGKSSDTRMKYVMQYSPIPLTGATGSYDDEELHNQSGLYTPTEYIRDNDRIQLRQDIAFNGGVIWMPGKGWTLRSSLSYSLLDLEDQRFFGVTTYYARMNSSVKGRPANEITNTDGKRLTNSNTIQYDFKSVLCKHHSLTGLVGQEINVYNQRRFISDVDGFPEDFTARESFKFTSQGSSVLTNNYYMAPDRLFSYFTRWNYSYKGRYILTGTFRADGSSKFRPENHWGYFPSAAAAWRISDEGFMKGSKVFSSLKLRASYGQAGNNNIPAGQTYAEYISESSTRIPFESPTAVWTLGSIMPNPDLKWETTTTRNVGLDFGLLRNRLTGTVDVYRNTTDDLLILFPIKGSGYTNQYRNIGSTRNEGFEVSLTGQIIRKKNVEVTVTANVGVNRNTVTSLGGLDRIEAYAAWASTQIDYDFVVVKGKSLGQVWGYVSDGRYEASDFEFTGSATTPWRINPARAGQVVDNSTLTGSGGAWGPGAIKLRDLDGDMAITANGDRTYLGSTLPKATGGLVLSGRVYGFDFNANFNYTVGNKILNANKAEYTTSSTYAYQNILTTMDSSKRWRSIDDNGQRITDVAELERLNASTSMWSPVTSRRFVSSYIVEDGSFVRLSGVTLGYTLPDRIVRRLGIRSVRAYVTGTNLWLLTGYSGFDPEVDTRRSTPLTPGVDYSPYPKTQGLIFGLNLNF